MNIVSGPVTVKHQLQHLGDVFRKYRTDKANALGEINSKNWGILSGKKKVHKIIIPFAVAANEYANVVGERFLADDSSFFSTECAGPYVPAGGTLLGWPNFGVDGQLNKKYGM